MKYSILRLSKVYGKGWKTIFVRLHSNGRDSEAGLGSQVILSHPSPLVSILTLNRIERANALDTQLVYEFRHHISVLRKRALARPSQCSVVVVASAHERVFCAGADLKQRAEQTVAEQRVFTEGLRDAFQQLAKLPCVTIAAINGAALGGGLELTLACDFRVGVETATMALPETGLGILPGAGGTQRLPRLIGVSRAKEMILCGRRYTGTDAFSIGLLDRCVNATAVQEPYKNVALQEACQMADELLQRSPVALRLAKEAIDSGMDAGSISSGLDVEGACYSETFATEDRSEGIRSFAERRKPVFRGL